MEYELFKRIKSVLLEYSEGFVTILSVENRTHV